VRPQAPGSSTRRTDFDAAYSHHMNMDHTKSVALFEGASSSEDAAFAGFAQKTLP